MFHAVLSLVSGDQLTILDLGVLASWCYSTCPAFSLWFLTPAHTCVISPVIKPSSNYSNLGESPIFLLSPEQRKHLPDCSGKQLLASPAKSSGRLVCGGQVRCYFTCLPGGVLAKMTLPPVEVLTSRCHPRYETMFLNFPSQSSKVTTSALMWAEEGPCPNLIQRRL